MEMGQTQVQCIALPRASQGQALIDISEEEARDGTTVANW
jgi:hypothetical protein